MAVHHDTFPLGIEKFGQARRDLLAALLRENVSPEDFFVVEPGQHFYMSEEIEAGDHGIGRVDEFDEWIRNIAAEDEQEREIRKMERRAK